MALLYKDNINVIRSHSDVYNSSHLECECRIDNIVTRVIVLYRPPIYNEHGLSFNDFIDAFSTFLEKLIVFQGNLLIVGDFSVYIDCGDSDKCIGLLDRYELK